VTLYSKTVVLYYANFIMIIFCNRNLLFILRYTGLKEQLYLASSLDPRFKSLPFLTDDEREEVFTQLTDNTKTLATEKSSVSAV